MNRLVPASWVPWIVSGILLGLAYLINEHDAFAIYALGWVGGYIVSHSGEEPS